VFKKILIANRGEIACRVIKTARKMGVKTVAVYSDADQQAQHVKQADEAVHIGPAEVGESYLRADKILAAAKQTGAEAIHPGYGFLSENADFAESCATSGLVFIGPPASAIRDMGLKDAAKILMEKANVPVVPGYHGQDQAPGLLAAKATEIGYPVLVKAVAGGGGKGMRRVDDESEFAAALESAQREGEASFGDARVLIEKYLVKPRHIEIQLFADSHGNAVHLFERDCSLQRRHQKVVEEAPAPDMPDDMRLAMGEAAVAAAKAIGYEGAGTVEFIADVRDGLQSDKFYFMEMNTRLQVEHPVTEMITGQDLVAWQLIVASGGELPVSQNDLTISGHSLEVRLYAEDPQNDFLPAIGKLLHLVPPTENDNVRVDTGVVEGDQVSPYYDPMIAKLITWGENREAALRQLQVALADYQVAGVTTNIDFLTNVAAHPAFMAKDLDTGFIERYQAKLMPATGEISDQTRVIACLYLLLKNKQDMAARAAVSSDPYSPWTAQDAWVMNAVGHSYLHFETADGEEERIKAIFYKDGSFGICLPSGEVRISGNIIDGKRLEYSIDSLKKFAVVVERGADLIILADKTSIVTKWDKLHDGGGEDIGDGAILSPMPGKIIDVATTTGAAVQKGDLLMTLEAMKMEHRLTAAADGVVEEIFFEKGDQVEDGVTLIRLKHEEE
jgi:3-methylcrotonyl-CoA carboxylase alpha subunit